MKALARKRRSERAQALRTLGFDPDVVNVFAAQAQTILSEAEWMKLPVAPSSGGVIVRDSAGTLGFRLGVSSLGGSDPL